MGEDVRWYCSMCDQPVDSREVSPDGWVSERPCGHKHGRYGKGIRGGRRFRIYLTNWTPAR